MKFTQTMSAAVFCFLSCGCSNSDLPTDLTSVVTSAVSLINDALPGSSTSVSLSRADIPTEYGSANIQIFGSGYFTTPKTLVQYVLNKAVDTDPGDGMGLINRFKQKIVSGMCPIIGLHPDADGNGIPDVGTGTFTLPNFSDASVRSSIEAKCPNANVDSLVSASGATIGYAVTSVAAESGSLYDIKSVIDFGNDSTTDNVLFFKADGKVIRFAFGEVDSGFIDSASLFEYDGTTLKFDFHGGNQDGHYRLLFNNTSKDFSIYAHVKNDANNRAFFSLVGNKNNTIAAMTMTAIKSGSTVVNNGQACVQTASTTFDWDSNFSGGGCASVAGASFATTPAVVALTEAFQGSIATASFDFTDKPLFSTSSDILTSAIIQ
jgi:hypothetical protein